ncbi:hypothetical protein HanIR_Chr04g0195311 [Helianthus annuus]|nr:hypothetical protein HanIR_Chr04g0195311 [Helianthus annuus]
MERHLMPSHFFIQWRPLFITLGAIQGALLFNVITVALLASILLWVMATSHW